MDILATRVLSYQGKDGDAARLILTVFMPFEVDEGYSRHWKCEFLFDPPIRTTVYGAGIDFIQAFVECLKVARIFIECTAPFSEAHWQGFADCGLPSEAKEPVSLELANIALPEGDARGMEVLTTRRLGYPNESGAQRELLLSIFKPFKALDEQWKCGFTLGQQESTPIRYGIGADYIEALLDGLAMARASFEEKTPKNWAPSGELQDCADLPYKIGRSFWTDLTVRRAHASTLTDPL